MRPAAERSPLERYLLTPVGELADASREKPWDAVVVGGGTAGLTAARTLAERGRRVAVVEGGPLALLTHASTTDLRFDNAGLGRFRGLIEYGPHLADGGAFGQLIACVGGRALFWNGAAPRFAERDFAAWPITLAELAPHYDWAEQEMRVTRDYGAGGLGQTVVRLLREAGLPAAPGPYAIDTHTTRDGWIGGTLGNPIAALLRTNLLTATEPLLQLAARAFATRILLDREGRASGITVTSGDDGSTYELLARCVVLAAGGFESVRLAMSSALPDRSSRLGRGIVDHLFCRAYYPVPVALYDPETPEAAIIAVPADDQRPFQLEIHMPSDNLFMLNEFTVWNPHEDDAFYAAMIRSFAPAEPSDENFIELGQSDAPGDYTVHFNYSAADLALLEEMTGGLDRVRTALNGEQAEPQRFGPGDSHHEAGGLAMGDDPSTSVTDPYGRFHSVSNIIVADASSWPTVSPANPCLTITALARRHAEQLHQDLG